MIIKLKLIFYIKIKLKKIKKLFYLSILNYKSILNNKLIFLKKVLYILIILKKINKNLIKPNKN